MNIQIESDLQQKKVHRQNAPQEINCKENKSEESKGRVNELKTTGSLCESSRNKKFFIICNSIGVFVSESGIEVYAYAV